jgi:hypothetical protein
MAQYSFTAEHHQKAFELFFLNRNWKATAEALETTSHTIYSWSRPIFQCKENCPYHGWDSLIEERTKIQKAQLDAHVRGAQDPLSQGSLIHMNADSHVPVSMTPAEAQQSALIGIHKSEVERLTQLELLYNKVFFDLTGIPLAYSQFKDLAAASLALKDIYNAGLHATTFREATNALSTILGEIEKCKRRLGLIDQAGKVTEAPLEEKVSKQEKLTLQDLRNIRNKIDATTPEELEMMRQQFASEQRTLQPQ